MANANKAAKQAKTETAVRTSTHEASKRAPVSESVEKALRHGDHISASALAIVLIGGESEKTIERNRLEIVKNMLQTATDEEIKETLRAAKKEEKVKTTNDDGEEVPDKTAPENYGPLVVELVKHGMKLGPAKARASEVRTIVNAFPHGDGIKPNEGWSNTLARAREKQDADKAQQAEAEMSKMRRDFIAEYIDQHGDEADIGKAREYADKQMEKAADEQADKDAVSARNAEVKRLANKFTAEDRLLIVKQVAASLGYDVVEMPKAKRGKTNITEMPATEKADTTAVH